MFLIRFYNLFFCLVFCSNKYHRQPKDCIKSFNFHFLILLLGLWMRFDGYFTSSFIIVITFVFSFLFNFFPHLVIEQCNITIFYRALMEYLNMSFQCVPAQCDCSLYEENMVIKVGLSPSKTIFFLCFNDSTSKMMTNAFYFILKALFVLTF